MPNQCVHCGKIYPDASKELLEGCSCGSHFFFFIKQEQINKLEEEKQKEVIEPIIDLKEEEKDQIEEDIREIIGIEEESIPVILDLESVRVTSPGKFELDVINLFSKRRPLIYKLEEGKYIIDLAASFRLDLNKVKRKIKDPFSKD